MKQPSITATQRDTLDGFSTVPATARRVRYSTGPGGDQEEMTLPLFYDASSSTGLEITQEAQFIRSMEDLVRGDGDGVIHKWR